MVFKRLGGGSGEAGGIWAQGTPQLDPTAVTDVRGKKEKAPTPSWVTRIFIIWHERRKLYRTRFSRTFKQCTQSAWNQTVSCIPYKLHQASDTTDHHYSLSPCSLTDVRISWTSVHAYVFWTCFAISHRSPSLCPVGRAKLSVGIDDIPK
ncbi:hypothetical protein ARMSODRAFT_371982 [Armillaria solidipes]|uniref:Uncharacterized protein n=1 Tax=Armillaria solidipes TaxID=1076256 RepID=A0A2H3B5K2_9AGAR|nr:hypothetical protein ARMSODRAFT_371982 [Armillaria solidipes]